MKEFGLTGRQCFHTVEAEVTVKWKKAKLTIPRCKNWKVCLPKQKYTKVNPVNSKLDALKGLFDGSQTFFYTQLYKINN